jgi:hypothetical protein
LKARVKKTIKGERTEEHYLDARDHINLYSVSGITRVLERCGFSGVKFQHLSPIQSIAGSNKAVFRVVKNGYFTAARTLSWMTGGNINIDNLFVTAIKPLEGTSLTPPARAVKFSGNSSACTSRD